MNEKLFKKQFDSISVASTASFLNPSARKLSECPKGSKDCSTITGTSLTGETEQIVTDQIKVPTVGGQDISAPCIASLCSFPG